jgi:hypothetical protein
MRLRVGLLLCLFAILTAVGCRKALAPNVDRNKAPETWITAAPFDTITTKKGDPVGVTSIPIRFHVYWAGSDQDGAVTGYYWAVTETIPSVRRLPGPRASDYHFTTKTDSTFIFNVAEDVPDRLHEFYIYAVDDQGKPDPTPARFVFNALERAELQPVPIFDEAYAVGTTYSYVNGVLTPHLTRVDLTDSFVTASTPPADTIPSTSRITFKYHGEIRIIGSVIKGYRYKLDEPQLMPTNPDSLWHKTLVEYHVPAAERDPEREGADTLSIISGKKTFRLRVVDGANGSRDVTRYFQSNFSPDTWFAGPDPGFAGIWQTTALGEKFVRLVNGKVPAGGVPGTLISNDSTQILPADRVPHKTFLEVYGDTLFLRNEGDTVHLGSWVIIHNGGFDKDSPYTVKVADGIQLIQPSFPGGAVLTPSKAANGSPIGFRFNFLNFLTPVGPTAQSAQSQLYPFFDPNDVFNFQRIGAYQPMTSAGKEYVLIRSEDGDGARDNRVDDARRVYEFPRNAYEQSLKPLILTYNVDFPPVLDVNLPTGLPNPAFRPSVTSVDTFTSRIWDLNLPGSDRDPYVSGDRVGGPSNTSTLRWRLTVTGKDTTGAPLVYHDAIPSYLNQPAINFLVPCNLGTGPAKLTVELCDCAICIDSNAGEGRCITRDIDVYYKRPTSASVLCGSSSGPGTTGPLRGAR